MLVFHDPDLAVPRTLHSDAGHRRPSKADVLNIVKALQSCIDEDEAMQGFGLIRSFLTWIFFSGRVEQGRARVSRFYRRLWGTRAVSG